MEQSSTICLIDIQIDNQEIFVNISSNKYSNMKKNRLNKNLKYR